MVSEGRKQITWSTGRRDLRRLAGLGREQSDEEVADEEVDADERVALAAEAWGSIWVDGADRVTGGAGRDRGRRGGGPWAGGFDGVAGR